jgi:hypothetical protein
MFEEDEIIGWYDGATSAVRRSRAQSDALFLASIVAFRLDCRILGLVRIAERLPRAASDDHESWVAWGRRWREVVAGPPTEAWLLLIASDGRNDARPVPSKLFADVEFDDVETAWDASGRWTDIFRGLPVGRDDHE